MSAVRRNHKNSEVPYVFSPWSSQEYVARQFFLSLSHFNVEVSRILAVAPLVFDWAVTTNSKTRLSAFDLSLSKRQISILQKKNLLTCKSTRSMTMTSSLGSTPNVANWVSLVRVRTVLMRSLHFFGVSSALPARNRQHVATTFACAMQAMVMVIV